MMDFELNIIHAFDPLFIIKGCLFHFSQAGKESLLASLAWFSFKMKLILSKLSSD